MRVQRPCEFELLVVPAEQWREFLHDRDITVLRLSEATPLDVAAAASDSDGKKHDPNAGLQEFAIDVITSAAALMDTGPPADLFKLRQELLNLRNYLQTLKPQRFLPEIPEEIPF